MLDALSRRAFLDRASRGAAGLAWAGILGSALPGCTLPVRSFRAPAGGSVEVPLGRYPELERPGGTVLVLTRDHGPIHLRAEEGGGFRAISAVCTHRGATVHPAGDGFRCPRHGSTFDGRGRNTGGPAERPLPGFPALRRGDAVAIDLSGGSAS